MAAAGKMLLVARREIRLLTRSRAILGAVVILASVAYLPAILLPLRRGSLGIASFTEMLPLQVALEAVLLPLLALLAGAELFAGELADGSLVPALTLPISRRALFAGKCLGRATALGVVYLAVFASAGLTVAAAHGGTGWRDWAVVGGVGFLLSLSSGGIGAAMGAAARGRVRAFAAALVGWIVVVFALDAALLTIIVAFAPTPPDSIGSHGHGEVAAPGSAAARVGGPRAETPSARSPSTEMPIHDPHAREAEPDEPTEGALSIHLLAASPVSLFRLTSLAASPELRPRLALALAGQSDARLWATILLGWLVWLVAPLAIGLRRFVRGDLN